jgi:hypothetical protein
LSEEVKAPLVRPVLQGKPGGEGPWVIKVRLEKVVQLVSRDVLERPDLLVLQGSQELRDIKGHTVPSIMLITGEITALMMIKVTQTHNSKTITRINLCQR